jgi:RecA-family ATPase
MQLVHCQYHDDTQFNYWQQQKIIPFSEMSRMGLAPTQLSIQWVPVLAPGVYHPRHELDHTPHLVPQLCTNGWNYICTPLFVVMAHTGQPYP